MDEWLRRNLVCPRDHNKLELIGNKLVCSAGHEYPIIKGIPVMLLDEVTPTHKWHSRDTFEKVAYIENSDESETSSYNHVGSSDIDPYVQHIVGATSGYLYVPLINKMTRYPIPEIRLPKGNGEILLDIGCNWGRWSVAAAQKGYSPIGIDPSLKAVMAAQNVSRQMGVSTRFVVADARYLPFAQDCFDLVFSFGVLQHFSKENVRLSLDQIARVLKDKGTCLIQMPNMFGIRSLYHQIRRGFKEVGGFEVRYWTLPELRKTFTRFIGETSLSVDGYFGLGIQKSDAKFLPAHYRLIVYVSEILRVISTKAGFMKYFADSIYLKSIR